MISSFISTIIICNINSYHISNEGLRYPDPIRGIIQHCLEPASLRQRPVSATMERL